MCFSSFQPLKQLMPTEVGFIFVCFVYFFLQMSIILDVMHFQKQHNHLHVFGPLLDAGAPVYLYQFQHRPSFLRDKRPSFVGSDHIDEIFAVLGSCFSTSDVQLIGKENIKSLFRWTIRDPGYLWVSSCRVQSILTDYHCFRYMH